MCPRSFAEVLSDCFSLLARVHHSITPTGILPQPHGKTAIVSGLNYISRIFALLGEIQVRIRVDKRSPPQGPFATARLEEVRSLHTRIMHALTHAPVPLRLKTASGGHAELGGAGFRQATFAEVKDFFDNPNASRANASNAFLVMQANLYVTQVREEDPRTHFFHFHINFQPFPFPALVSSTSISHYYYEYYESHC